MDDERKEENQASTSKKEAKQKEIEDYEDRDRDDRSYTDTTGSAYSGRSRLEVRADREPRPEPPKNALGKSERPKQERKKKLRRGRVVKRRRSTTRRYQPIRRTVKRKPVTKRDREGSVSTIFTRLSSRSSSNTPSCTYCGHRCCGRRYKERKRGRKTAGKKTTRKAKAEKSRMSRVKKRSTVRERNRKRVIKNAAKRNMRRLPRTMESSKGTMPVVACSEAIQIGSKTKMLSPLFVKTNAATPDDKTQFETEPPPQFLKITPDMIYESLRKLTAWTSIVTQDALCSYMKLNYPVNSNDIELDKELTKKLKVATLAGIVEEVQKNGQKYWCLSCELLQRGLTKNHVTIFWHLYGDTMTPVHKKVEEESPNPNEFQGNVDNKASRMNPFDSRVDYYETETMKKKIVPSYDTVV